MNNKILIILIIMLMQTLPLISAVGRVVVSPNPVPRDSWANVTIYPSGGEPMTSIGGVVDTHTGMSIGPYFEFADCPHYHCYSPRTTSFYVGKYWFRNYYVGVWDHNIEDFVQGYFTTTAPICENDVLDPNETDIDCGGIKCPKCWNGKSCLIDSDCFSLYCNSNNKCEEFGEEFDKNKEKYSKKEVFLISDEDWKSALKLVPLSTWNQYNNNTQEQEIKKFPVLIYHKENNNFDADSIIQFFQDYSPSHVTIFGETPKKLDKLLASKKNIGAELNEEQITRANFNDYYSYWNSFNEVVISEDKYEAGLISSIFSSYKNIPLVFENEIDYGAIKDKDVYIIGDVSQEKVDNINLAAKTAKKYSVNELQKEYTELSNTDKVIAVNPNDLGIKLEKSFSTKKSTKIKELYNKNSLASPFLAAAKNEAIIFVNLPKSPENSGCSENQDITNNFNTADSSIETEIENLNISAEYLTIFASPNSIPDSLFRKCHESGSQLRNSSDVEYATINNELINFGRIYGISTSDTSSYVARDLFYEKISEDSYGQNSTGLTIGHSFESYSDNMKKIYDATSNSGYDLVCYTGEEREGCVKKTKAPLSEYNKKQFIIFGDHGYPNQWYQTLKSKEIPELDLSYVFSHACSTNNFYKGKEGVMGANMIRNGAIAYHGASGLSYSDDSESIALQKITSSNLSLGELNKELAEELKNYKKDYSMIGDPTLKINLKKVDWTNYSFTNNIGSVEESIENSDVNIKSIASEKETYVPDEDIIIKAVIKNNQDSSLNISIEHEIYTLSGYISEIESEVIALEPLEEKEISFSMKVGNTIPSEKYYAALRIVNGENIIDEKKAEFNVNETLKTIDVELKACEDINCENESRIFSKEEKIYLDYISSETINPDIHLIKPDLSNEEITLPYEFSSLETGNYKLIFNYSDTGYDDVYEEIEFAIVDDLDIPASETCNANNICDANENEQNCPQDCIYVSIPDERIVQLNKGWNLISAPILIENNTVNNIFNPIINKVIISYIENGVWSFFPEIENFPEILLIEPKKAYFLKANETSENNISGNMLDNNEYSLNTGINLISYPCKTEKNISEVFSLIIEDVESVETLDNGAKTYVPDHIEYSDLIILKPNSGYIVKMKKPNKLKFDC